MKKKVSILFGVILALVFAFALTACGKVSLKLTFKVDGVDYATISTSGDEVIKMPENPTKDGYEFDGWFWDEGTWQRPFTANSLVDTPISSDTSVYAKLVAAHKHAFSKEWSKNAVYHWRVATCDDTDEISDKAEHVFADGVCTTCGISVTPTSDFNFKEVEEGYEIIGYTGGSLDVVIPETYNDKPIVGLSNYAFVPRFSTLFDSDLEVQSLLLSKNIKRIDNEALSVAISMKYMGVDKDNGYFKSIDGNIYSKDGKTLCAYAYAKSDIYFEIPYGVEKIDKYAMYSCYLLRLTIPETVTEIDAYGIGGLRLTEIFNFSDCQIRNLEQPTPTSFPVHPTIYTDKATKSKLYYMQSDYIVFDDNGVIVLAAYVGNELEAVLPQEIGKIGQFAFANDKTESIVLDGNVTEITETYCFACYKLKRVKFAGKIRKVGDVFFSGMTSLSEFYLGDNVEEFSVPSMGIKYTVSENNTHYKAIDGNLYSKDGKALYSVAGKGLTEFKVPEGVETIYEKAFSSCDFLTKIIIPSSVKNIENQAFDGCRRLIEVYDLSGSSVIHEYLRNCGGVGSYYPISIANDIKTPSRLTKEDGFIVFSSYYDGNVLVGYVGDETSITIPDGIARIGKYAFEHCSYLVNVVIPNSVTSIEEFAFYNCSNLTSVAMGNSVTSIGEGAFRGCSKLTSVYYIGNAEDWAEVSISWDNDYLTSATRYYYSETEPEVNPDGTADDGNYWRYVDGVPTVWKKEN